MKDDDFNEIGDSPNKFDSSASENEDLDDADKDLFVHKASRLSTQGGKNKFVFERTNSPKLKKAPTTLTKHRSPSLTKKESLGIRRKQQSDI